jgi:hypothetical protein
VAWWSAKTKWFDPIEKIKIGDEEPKKIKRRPTNKKKVQRKKT